MSTYLPHDVQRGLDLGRASGTRKKRSRLRVVIDGQSHPVSRMWSGGFAMSAEEETPRLRGIVDLFDGPSHIGRCLIVATGEEEGERRFEFKRAPAAAAAPPADFVRETDPPVALLPRAEG